MPHYRSLTGHNWPPGIRREAGQDVSDMPASSLLLEIRDGHVEAYDPDAPTEAGPPAGGSPTTPLPALPDFGDGLAAEEEL